MSAESGWSPPASSQPPDPAQTSVGRTIVALSGGGLPSSDAKAPVYRHSRRVPRRASFDFGADASLGAFAQDDQCRALEAGGWRLGAGG